MTLNPLVFCVQEVGNSYCAPVLWIEALRIQEFSALVITVQMTGLNCLFLGY